MSENNSSITDEYGLDDLPNARQPGFKVLVLVTLMVAMLNLIMGWLTLFESPLALQLISLGLWIPILVGSTATVVSFYKRYKGTTRGLTKRQIDPPAKPPNE